MNTATLRLITSPPSSPLCPLHARRQQLWRAAWLLVAGRVEPEVAPLAAERALEVAVFRADVATVTALVGDRAPASLPALVACASWLQLGVPPAPGFIAVFAGHVASWRSLSLSDDQILTRLRAMLQRSDA